MTRLRIVVVLALATVAVAVAGCGGTKTVTVTSSTVAKAPAPVTPASCPTGDNHSLGQCLPQSSAPQSTNKSVTAPAPAQCVDLSNNDPIYGVGAWRTIKAHGWNCLIVKVNESTGFVDSTAAPMARDAKAAGLVVGGYDFQHVCLSNPASEATVFAEHLKADGLTGSHTTVGWADEEYPSSTGCNVLAWEKTWHATADKLLGRATGTYTGAWWIDPHQGCSWVGSYAWISGYTAGGPPLPCGHRDVDLWQFSDHGFNGVGSSDVNVWRKSAAAFDAMTDSTAADPLAIMDKTKRHIRVKAPSPTFGAPYVVVASEHGTMAKIRQVGCTGRPIRSACKSSKFHLTLLRDRLVTVGTREKPHYKLRGQGARQTIMAKQLAKLS